MPNPDVRQNEASPAVKKGWECPKCGAVYAPWMPACSKCKPKPEPRRSRWTK